MKEIGLDTKIADLLNDYDGMKDILIEINPKFKKLNNPILRRTLGKVAGVSQAAIVGGMDPNVLLNKLRKAVGQSKIEVSNKTIDENTTSPKWIELKPRISINANEILDDDKNPLAVANKILKDLSAGEIMTIISDFRPEPLIDEFEEKKYDVYCLSVDDKFITYIKK